MSNSFRLRTMMAALAVFAALVLVASTADARVGGGRSIGSRGSHTFSAPPQTRTAPNQASPIERSVTQPQRPTTAGAAQGAPNQGGLFGRPGFAGGLLAGFLGAGLLGMLFGNGMFGGLGAGFASVLGLLLQVALVVIVARLIWSWWQRRNGYATAGGPSLRDIGTETPRGVIPGGSAGFSQSDAVAINEADFNTFERLLGEVQAAYSAEDLNKLRTLVTPEMLGYFAEDLSGNVSRGVVNELGATKLLSGDLAEAWREGNTEYATVAMRYELTDAMVERATGRVVEGSRTEKQEVTELWTFMRSRGGNWILSAIQQS